MNNHTFIYLDVANTLLYKPQLFKVIQQTLLKFEIEIDLAFIQQRHKIISEATHFPAKTSKEFYDIFNRELLIALGLIPTKEIIDTIFHDCSYLEWQKFEDTKALYELDCPLGIISNWDETLESKLNVFFNINFAKVITSKKVGYNKPDLQIFKLACQDLDYNLEDILYVGDSIKLDFLPALNIGFNTILIDREDHYPYFNGPKIKSLFELAQRSDSKILDRVG